MPLSNALATRRLFTSRVWLMVICVIAGGMVPISGSPGSLQLRPIRASEELPSEEHSHSSAAPSHLAAHPQHRVRKTRSRDLHLAHVASQIGAQNLGGVTRPLWGALPPQEHALRFGLGTPLRI